MKVDRKKVLAAEASVTMNLVDCDRMRIDFDIDIPYFTSYNYSFSRDAAFLCTSRA